MRDASVNLLLNSFIQYGKSGWNTFCMKNLYEKIYISVKSGGSGGQTICQFNLGI